jgi:hypothetical protein
MHVSLKPPRDNLSGVRFTEDIYLSLPSGSNRVYLYLFRRSCALLNPHLVV